MWRRGATLAASLVALSACGGSQTHSRVPPHYEGDPNSRPSLDALPSADVDDAALTHEMRFAEMLSSQSLDVPDPPMPVTRSASELEGWSDQVLKRWVQQKQAAAEAARKELDRAAAQSHRQRIMAGAIVGLVYEDLVRVLLEVPTPEDLAREPEILEIYKGMLVRQAMPYLLQAKAAYTACAGNAAQLERMRHWASFCAERAARLPGEEEQHGAGTTTVTVVAP